MIPYKFLLPAFILCIAMTTGFNKPGPVKAIALASRINAKNDTTYIVSFWATWCGPCVQELPSFEKINDEFGKKKVKVILVSMDFASEYDSKLVPFLEKKNLSSEVLWLNESRPNEFIDKINPKWQGSIPATMIISSKKSLNELYEEQVNYELLVSKLKEIGI